jgi:hypothetical protein
MPMLFWYPMIVWSSMIGLALERAQPRAHRAPQPDNNAGAQREV